MKLVRITFNLIVFVAGMYWFAGKFSPNWELGRYYMPRLVAAADGQHYASGETVDAFSLAIVQSGRQEELALAILTIILAVIGWDIWRKHRKPQEFD